jgi:CrcB protein
MYCQLKVYDWVFLVGFGCWGVLNTLIGLFYAWSARFNLATEYRVLLTTGLCGGFTTFSTFSNDGVILLKQGLYGLFFTYFILSITLGVIAAIAGGVIGGK